MSRILLIDDEPMILTSLTRLLEDDFEVSTAPDGFKALELIAKSEYKVIICDQRMPGMLGHEVLKKARELSPKSIRILLTGYSDLDSIINSVNAGEVFRYINKPWKADNLINIVKLGIQIYDKINDLQASAPKPVGGATAASVHIEVEEKKGDVLFVDYSPEEVKRLANQFGNKFNITMATSVDEAFKEMAQKPVSVIVSNVVFEDGVDGISFLNTIKKEYPQTVTVILTEVKDATLAVRSINELQVFKYLVKPTDQTMIEKTISDGIMQSRAIKGNAMASTKFVSETIAPSQESVSQNESALRLRLRAAQALLARR
ncbi:MAG: response regulator [Bacteroidetes bacterium]|nr:response regulator [Bacteroidota bacterium]